MKPYLSYIRIISVITLFFYTDNLVDAQFNNIRPDSNDRVYEVLLLGNTGASGTEELSPTLKLLKHELDEAGKNSVVVFSGDLVQSGGLPAKGKPGSDAAEQQLLQLVEVVRGYPGKVFFVPGDNRLGA